MSDGCVAPGAQGRRYLPAEDEEEVEDHESDAAGGVDGLEAGGGEVGEGGGEEQIDPDEEEHLEAAQRRVVGQFGVAVQADGIVPAEKEENGHEGVPADLDANVAQYENCLKVRD